jgi:L-alanine-DL-glutamate epimerase-like enolase superfamily enzyme
MISPDLRRATAPTPMSAARIDGVTVHRISRAVDPPLISGIHNIASIELNVVEVHSGEYTGLGYTYAFSAREAEAVTPLILHIAELLDDLEVAALRAHHSSMWRRINFIGRGGPPVMALSALDTALWDLHARTLNVPLHVLLGLPRSELRVYAAGGSRALGLEGLIAEALDFQARGYAGYKLRAGGEDWREDVRRVSGVRSALGPEMALMVDANQAWSAETAIHAAVALGPLELAWLEEPVDGEDFAATAAVRERAPMPIASGESIYGVPAFERLIAAGAVDVLQPDLMRCGGISGFLEIAEMARRAGLRISPHLFCEITPHLSSASGTEQLAEYLPGWFDGLFEGAPQTAGGSLAPGSGPGLGLSLSASALADHKIATFEL